MIHEKIFVLFWALVTAWPLGAAEHEAPRLQGEPTQGSLLVGRIAPGSSVQLESGSAVVTAEGWLLLALGREHPATSALVIEDGAGTRIEASVEVAPRDYRIQRINGLPPAQVTPAPEVLERIRREQAAVAKARRGRRESLDFLSGFRMPLSGRLTGVYGSQRILNGEPRQPHYGVDIAGPVGAPVAAPAAGKVTLAEPDLYFSGGTLIIDHGYGLSSSFLHLSELLVEVGTQVEPGDVVARVGATGRVTGPHLDWRMNLGTTRIDPLLVMKALPARD